MNDEGCRTIGKRPTREAVSPGGHAGAMRSNLRRALTTAAKAHLNAATAPRRVPRIAL